MRAGQAPVGGAFAGQAAQREPLEEAAAGEQHDQQDGEQEARHGVADQHHGAGGDVEAAAVAHRLGDAERDGDQIDQQRGPQAERDRHRHLLQDELQHRLVAEEAAAEVEAQIAADHVEEARQRRLVEAEHLLDVGDDVRIEAARAAIASGAAEFGRRGAEPRRQVALAAQFGDHLLHRAAGRELDDREVDGDDAEQRRDHQQQAADEIGGHSGALPAVLSPHPLPQGTGGRSTEDRFRAGITAALPPRAPWPSPGRPTRCRS